MSVQLIGMCLTYAYVSYRRITHTHAHRRASQVWAHISGMGVHLRPDAWGAVTSKGGCMISKGGVR
jgi:hypothetical protein